MKSYKKGMMVRLHILLRGNGVGVQFFCFVTDKIWEDLPMRKSKLGRVGTRIGALLLSVCLLVCTDGMDVWATGEDAENESIMLPVENGSIILNEEDMILETENTVEETEVAEVITEEPVMGTMDIMEETIPVVDQNVEVKKIRYLCCKEKPSIINHMRMLPMNCVIRK